MREIIEIDKDFNLNTVKHSKKIKPNSKIKGKVNISLYDENNNLVRDIHTENLIMDWFKDETYERGFIDLVGKNAYRSSQFGTSSSPISPFAYLVLSDQDIEESSKDPFILKNTIGYAQRRTTYSGADTLKGSYNEVESKVYTDEEGNLVCHEVYDFPTHACNGTINSLMWSPHYNNTDGVRIGNFSSQNSVGSNGQVYCDKDESIVYTYASNNYYIAKLMFSDNIVWGVGNLKTLAGGSYSNSNQLGRLYIDVENNIVNLACYNTSSSTRYSIPAYSLLCCQYDLDTLELKDDYKIYSSDDLKLTIGSDNYVVEGYGTHNGEYIFYAIVKSTDRSKRGIVKANYEDGSLVKYYLFGDGESFTSSSGYNLELNIQDNNTFNVKYTCSPDSNEYIFDSNLNMLKKYSPIRTGADVGGCENAFVTYMNSYYSLYLRNTPASSYVKLTQPVTKTNTNTMKVQYDFVIEQPKVKGQLMKKRI